VEYEQFIRTVAHESGTDDTETAERATQATLETLADRLSKGEARDLLRELPAELKPWIYTEDDARSFDMDEYLRRIAERLGTDVETAERWARAVFFVLGKAVSPKEISDLAAELPANFDPLVAEAQGRFAEVMPVEEFLVRVATRTGLELDDAGRATAAVLETLAERIAAGEVDDLIPKLPIELHEPLKRGKSRIPEAKHMPLEEFLRRVAQREGLPFDDDMPPFEASEYARAVFATLREAIADEEFFDVTVQLPAEYAPLLPPLT
jgi:uncharacterized protein (DUF2267 family)